MVTKRRKYVRRTLVIAYFMCGLLNGCSTQRDVYREDLRTDSGEPGYVTVQHCLISFLGAPGIDASRSREEAEQLANELLEKARQGEDFDRLIRRYTDDSAPGIYRIANRGMPSDLSSIVPSKQVHARDDMVTAFGDVAFSLEVGEFGITEYDEKTSPVGWHIIQRLK